MQQQQQQRWLRPARPVLAAALALALWGLAQWWGKAWSAARAGAKTSSVVDQNVMVVAPDDADTGLGAASQTHQRKRTRVCAVALNPRQGSLFRTNRIGMAGSGKYVYFTKAKCPWDVPRVRLISYVKCCETLAKVRYSIDDAIKTHDVVVVTGDEYCSVTDTRPHFRQYHGTSVISKAAKPANIPGWKGSREMMDGNATIWPLYIPLGPREEFERVDQATVKPSGQRKYLYNFLGSMTSYSRRVLKRILLEDLTKRTDAFPGFVHITDKWHVKVNTQNGYITPERYRLILLDSVFTLCPTGHNPEAYRIYEALEAGSIPILSLDRWYNRHDCEEAFKPYRDANAPFIYLNGGWGALESFFEKRGSNKTWVAERQVAVRNWYQWWMHQTALRFEAVLEMRFNNRMRTGKRDEVLEAKEDALVEEEERAILNEENKDQEQLEPGSDGADETA